MTDTEFATILQQHTQLWTAVVVLAFLQLLWIIVIAFSAAWSVRSVNKRQDAIEAAWRERLEATQEKWNQLVEILLHNAREHA
jgi:hypothetical protein